MTLDQISATARDDDFRARVKAAVYGAAVAIVGEDTSSMTPAKAQKRHRLGVAVLQNNVATHENFCWAVSTQVGEVAVPADIIDAAISSTVSAVWDDIAGVTYDESNPP